jgi:hypothetical protein
MGAPLTQPVSFRDLRHNTGEQEVSLLLKENVRYAVTSRRLAGAVRRRNAA